MTSSLPSVSVLLPVYNAGRHLVRAVESILSQSHAAFELLAIDDGSTDGSGELLESLDDPRLRIVHQRNRGLAATLQTGLELASHEFIARMDADDVSLPHRLAAQVAVLAAAPEVAALGCCYELINEDGAVLDIVHVPASPDNVARQLYFRNLLAHGSMMLRRTAVLEVGGYRDIGPAEDYDLWARLAGHHDIAAVPEVLYQYRVTASGVSQTSAARQRALTREIRSTLHVARPLRVPRPVSVARQGIRLLRDQPACDGYAESYVFDHAGLALALFRQRRRSDAIRMAAGTALFALARPRGIKGLANFRARPALQGAPGGGR